MRRLKNQNNPPESPHTPLCKRDNPPTPPFSKGGQGGITKGGFEGNLKGGKGVFSGEIGGETISPSKIIILGVGNLLLSDEGVGVHVANELMKMDLPPEVVVVEGGTEGFRLLNVIAEADRLIVVDAVRGGGVPGSIYRFDIEDVRNCPAGFKTSVHQIGILEVINLSGLVGKTPQTTIIGVEPKSLKMGMDLSPEIKAKIPRIIELIQDELKQFQNETIMPTSRHKGNEDRVRRPDTTPHTGRDRSPDLPQERFSGG
ncbi:MAG: HyaD/HybD family hydrogenase maturation endopeptidase [Nitrospirota bacterium]